MAPFLHAATHSALPMTLPEPTPGIWPVMLDMLPSAPPKAASTMSNGKFQRLLTRFVVPGSLLFRAEMSVAFPQPGRVSENERG